MRGLICFLIALVVGGIPVSWATADWKTGEATVAVTLAVLFTFIIFRVIAAVLFPSRQTWYGTEQRVR